MEALRTQLAFVKRQAKPTAKKSKQSASAECYKAIGRVDKELAQLQSRKLERYEAYRAGEISREDFIQIKDSLTSQAEALSAKKEQLEREYQTLIQAKQQEADARSEIEQAEQLLSDYEAGLREHLYDAIDRVIVTGNHEIEIRWGFADMLAPSVAPAAPKSRAGA